MRTEQLPMNFMARGDESVTSHSANDNSFWLGLSIDHRLLFDALQDDWLRPRDGTTGHLLGIRSFAAEEFESSDHRILVRLKFDPEHLPRIRVCRRRKSKWLVGKIDSHRIAADEAVFWPGPLPTFAITELLVASAEERARLAGLARQVSNVSLPVEPRVLRSGEDVTLGKKPLPDQALGGIKLPPDMDAVRGAMAMAAWAVPRVDPWLDLLCATLGNKGLSTLRAHAKSLQSPWWVWPPWKRPSPAPLDVKTQERLWLAAIDTFDRAAARSAVTAKGLLQEITDSLTRDASSADSKSFLEWSKEIQRILRGDFRIDLSDWKAYPVSKAIQLVLARPEPSNFMKWKDDISTLPPTVWWSAAALCGLLHGYRRLPTTFRGTADQQRLFTIYSLHVLDATPSVKSWASLARKAPQWSRQSASILLSWAGIPFARKPENARGKWFAANLDDSTVRSAAEEIGRSNEWDCFRTNISVPAGEISLSEGRLKVVSRSRRYLKLKDPVEFLLPQGSSVKTLLDAGSFRQCIAIEAANIPLPPEKQPGTDSSATDEVPGLLYVPDFLSEVEEQELITTIDNGDWSHVLKRRVQHFGWRYEYKDRKIDLSMRLGPLPRWALVLAERLKKKGLLPHLPDQVIVNEYIGRQGISKHTDCVPCFEDGVAMLSLIESWEMIFRKGGKASKRVSKLLARRSIAVISGDARYKWTHEIPSRLTEPGGLRRHRRVSVTFRKVNLD